MISAVIYLTSASGRWRAAVKFRGAPEPTGKVQYYAELGEPELIGPFDELDAALAVIRTAAQVPLGETWDERVR